MIRKQAPNLGLGVGMGHVLHRKEQEGGPHLVLACHTLSLHFGDPAVLSSEEGNIWRFGGSGPHPAVAA